MAPRRLQSFRPWSMVDDPVIAELEPVVAGEAEEEASDLVRPDNTVFARSNAESTPTIGADRKPFEPWTVVRVGEPAMLDNLRINAAKEKVRAE